MSLLAIPSTIYRDRIARFRSHSDGDESAYVLRAGASVLESLIVVNATSNARFLQLHDADELPDDTAVPLLSFVLPANGSVQLSNLGVYGASGIVAAVSTTQATLTISTDTALFFGILRA